MEESDRHLIETVLLEDLERLPTGDIRLNTHREGQSEVRDLVGPPPIRLAVLHRKREVSVFLHPLGVEMLGHVVAHGVGQQHHDALIGPQLPLLTELHGGPHRGPCGASGEKAFLTDEASGHHEGLLVFRFDPFVHQRSIKHPRDEVVTDTLHLVAGDLAVERVGLGEDGTHRIDTDHLDIWNLLLQLARDASDSSSRPRAHDYVVNLAVRLL
mmetsp:Transcript_11705/g.23551  ORF Transcript_11705/g.23551 Transcript_11705/m.23551 type:complete len:213 (+) Transcript_11705:1159-1797(+)